VNCQSAADFRVRFCLFLILSLSFPGAIFGGSNKESSGATGDSAHAKKDGRPSRHRAREPQDGSSSSDACALKHLGQCVKDVEQDQIGIWTSPFHATPGDAAWLLPIAGATGVAIHYDAQAQQDLGVDPTRTAISSDFSNATVYGSLAGDAGLYFLGVTTHNPHLAETGRLGAEAVADTAIVFEGLKLVTNRQRPNVGNGQGQFWPNGASTYTFDGSFPSGHTAVMFALARVISSEYPSKKVRIAAFALALAVGASRVTAREHFPSDVLVGGVVGYLVGGYVVRQRASTNTPSAFFVSPMVDASTQTYGVQVRLTPASLKLRGVRKFFDRLKPPDHAPVSNAELYSDAQ
jgi:membrane-associated phospholipid phosphatase